MSQNSLGPHVFVTFHNPQDRGGAPAFVQQQTEIVQRPGVEGTGIILHGRKGQPFQMRSGCDYATLGDALDAFLAYNDSVGTDPAQLVWGGTDYEMTFNVLYGILHVELIRARRISCGAGGTETTPGAWLEALWTLVPIGKGNS